ncbi:MAG: hypothetical protein ACK4TA_14920 [Saprospiraceae bacterium]
MKGAKTRQQMADEYGISRWTFNRWLKRANILLQGGLVTPHEQELVYQTFGYPDKKQLKSGQTR